MKSYVKLERTQNNRQTLAEAIEEAPVASPRWKKLIDKDAKLDDREIKQSAKVLRP